MANHYARYSLSRVSSCIGTGSKAPLADPASDGEAEAGEAETLAAMEAAIEAAGSSRSEARDSVAPEGALARRWVMGRSEITWTSGRRTRWREPETIAREAETRGHCAGVRRAFDALGGAVQGERTLTVGGPKIWFAR